MEESSIPTYESVNRITQTGDGRLWVGTRGGLSVFEGDGFRAIPFPDSLGQISLSRLQPAPDNAVWAGVPFHGLWRVDIQDGVAQVPETAGTLVRRILARADTIVAVDTDGLWKVPFDGGRPERTHFHHTWRPPSAARSQDHTVGAGITGADFAPDGTLWLLDQRLGAGKLEADGRIAFHENAVGEWVALHVDRRGIVWLLERSRGLFRRAADGSIEHMFDTGVAARLHVSGDKLFIATLDHRLISYDTNVAAVRRTVDLGRMLHPSTATAVHVDHQGSLWIGFQTGLVHVPHLGIRHRTRIGGEAVSSIGPVLAAPDGSVWASTWGRGLIRIRPDPAIIHPDDARHWSHSFAGQDGHLYAINRHGLYRYNDRGVWRRHIEGPSMVRGVVRHDGTAFVWQDDGIYRVAPGGLRELLFPWPVEDRDRHALTLNPDGRVVLRSGVALLVENPDGTSRPRFDTLAVLTGYEKAHGRFILADNEGGYWISLFSRGLLHVRNGVINEVVSAASVRSLTLADDGRVVAATSRGVFVFSAATGERQFHLSRSDGLLSNSASAALMVSDTLYVSHASGITHYPLEAVDGARQPPRVILQVDGSDRSYGFRFFSTDYRKREPATFQYRLNDGPWQETDLNAVAFSSLRHGRHEFSVRTRSAEGSWGPASSHTFEVPTPVHLRWWFLLIAGTAAGGAVLSLHRMRVRTLRRREKELVKLVGERTRHLAESVARTEEQARRLEELDQQKNRLFTDISHELRTPLTLLIGPTEHALNRPGSLSEDEFRKLLKLSLVQGRRLQSLVDEILALARIDAGGYELVLQRGDIIETARTRLDEFHSEAEVRGITLAFHTDLPRLDASFDPHAIGKIISNLVSNALRFTPAGGRIDVTIGWTGDDSPVRIAVCDTGTGIPAEALPHIFDRYFMRPADGQSSAGSGIGLALARELARLHGGDISVRSTEGSGSTFRVELPLEIRPDTALSPAQGDGMSGIVLPLPHRPSTNSPRDTKGGPVEYAPTVLVIEDNDDVCRFVTGLLEPTYDVIAASDGNVGMELALSRRPAAIISDVMMPGVDGFSLCETLKADIRTSTIPILLLTARASTSDTVHGLEAGADDYLTKPFSADELLARVARLIGSRRTMRDVYSERITVGPGEIDAPSTAKELLQRIEALLEENYADAEYSVERLAVDVGMSARQLRRRLGEASGMTPSEVIRSFRLERALQLIESAPQPVADIARRCGYTDARRFSGHFKERFGITPSCLPAHTEKREAMNGMADGG